VDHLRRWFAVYLFFAMFALFWALQWHAEIVLDANAETASPKLQWWAHTVENWQSEFLQLGFAALVVDGLKEKLFRKSYEDVAEIKERLDRIESRS
jgi:hypothetical protein